jgi:hypothetical protein
MGGGGTSLESCPVVEFDVGGVEVSATRELLIY